MKFTANKFSTFSKELILIINNEINESKNIPSISDLLKANGFIIKKINNELYASAFIQVESGTEKIPSFNNLGILVEKKLGNIWLAQIPIKTLTQLGNIPEVEFIKVSEPIIAELDKAREYTNVNELHSGYQLPQKFFGKNVIVGIIDKGFDYTHPTFFDSTYTELRIIRVWDQNAIGTPPTGYTYGNEIVGASNILSKKYDKIDESHGTHVAGIAAGSGIGTSGKYRGIAPASEIILVSSLEGGDLELAEAMEYIFNYANSVNKPAVINCSWGTGFGARDGLSPFDQAIDLLTGEGKIIIISAGNSGDEKFHTSHVFTSTDSVFGTFLKIDGNNIGTGEHKIDIWGGANNSFKIATAIVNADNSYAIEDYTPYISSKTDNIFNYTLIDDDPLFPDNTTIKYSTTSKVPYNLKPNIRLTVNNSDQDDDYKWIYIEIIAYNSTVHLWGDEGIEFTNLNLPSLGQGNSYYTITEPGNGNNVITVGAYNSTISTIGDMSSFSSKGPTTDGRIKPDITAPGNRITSSVSRFDSNYLIGGTYWADKVLGITDGTNIWYFASMQGTSMSAPIVTGIVALFLEANPLLAPSQLKDLIYTNSITDSYTGAIPNNIWGYGKIDAQKTINAILNTTFIKENKDINLKIRLFPNPTTGKIFLESKILEISRIDIYDLFGRLLISDNAINNREFLTYDLSNYKNGIYLIKVTCGSKSYLNKIVLHK